MNTYEQTKQAEPAEALEALIDVHGIARIVEILANVCDEKSNHVSENWQDYSLASKWSNAGLKLHNLKLPIL